MIIAEQEPHKFGEVVDFLEKGDFRIMHRWKTNCRWDGTRPGKSGKGGEIPGTWDFHANHKEWGDLEEWSIQYQYVE